MSFKNRIIISQNNLQKILCSFFFSGRSFVVMIAQHYKIKLFSIFRFLKRRLYKLNETDIT